MSFDKMSWKIPIDRSVVLTESLCFSKRQQRWAPSVTDPDRLFIFMSASQTLLHIYVLIAALTWNAPPPQNILQSVTAQSSLTSCSTDTLLLEFHSKRRPESSLLQEDLGFGYVREFSGLRNFHDTVYAVTDGYISAPIVSLLEIKYSHQPII